MADKKQRTAVFKGLNRMPYIGDGEMRNMRNLSSDAYPYITTRKGRKPYTFTTKIPSPEGEAYRDTQVLPQPDENEVGNVYKYIGNGFAPGAYYEFKDGEWKKVEVGVSGAVLTGNTLINGYSTNVTSSTKDEYTNGYPEEHHGDLFKYTGETTEVFQCGCIYRYVIDVWYEWYEQSATYPDGKGDVMPEPSAEYVGKIYQYTGETTEAYTQNKKYMCLRYMQGRWELVEGFIPTTKLPGEPAEGDTLRWCGAGELVNGRYYEVCVESGIQFYNLCDAVDGAISLSYLPPIETEVEGSVYLYNGPNVGDFTECYLEGGVTGWRVISHPLVEREVTLKDYLDNYDGSGLKEILEIGTFSGNLAALIIDGSGEYKLYYNEKLWPVNNISDESGKKLVTVGTRLVVGESGCYLHLKEGKAEDGTVTREIEFFEQGGAFSYSVGAKNFPYGNGGEREKLWEASGDEDGNVAITLYAPWGEGARLKAIYEGLKTEGTDFSVYAKRSGTAHKQYLTVTKATLEEKKLILAWSVGDRWYYDYADVLTISATGGWEEFDWYRATGDALVFESTDPHYYDVVAWKKRLWGYNGNVLHGTVADIFDDYGVVDWNTGDNTYTEAISQPLWQGNDITGVAALMSGLVYFKEDNITVVTGNYPAILNGDTIPCRGLPAENRRSVAVGNESVYYLGRSGVMRFDGGIPRLISQDVKISGTDAVGFSDGAKYYLSLKETDGTYALYVYDIAYGFWHKEDCSGASSFAMLNGCLHMAMGDEIYNLYAPQEDVPWELELWYDEGTHELKKYKEIDIRGTVGECELWLKADDGEWRLIGATDGKMRVKFIPFNCEELSLKLKGRGKCEIRSIDRTFEVVA